VRMAPSGVPNCAAPAEGEAMIVWSGDAWQQVRRDYTLGIARLLPIGTLTLA
jgi:hypothetical protein